MMYISISNYNMSHGLPPIRISAFKGDTRPQYCYEVEIQGPSRVIFDENLVLKEFGVHTSVETESPVVIIK